MSITSAARLARSFETPAAIRPAMPIEQGITTIASKDDDPGSRSTEQVVVVIAGKPRIVHPGRIILVSAYGKTVTGHDQSDPPDTVRFGQPAAKQPGIKRPARSGNRYDDIAFFLHIS